MFQRFAITSTIIPRSDKLNEKATPSIYKTLDLIIGHLNINSLRNKFSSLQQTVLSKTDIFHSLKLKLTTRFPILNS